MKEIFDNYVENAFGDFHQIPCKFDFFDHNYLQYLPSDKNAMVLDIGIGKGETLSSFVRHGYHMSHGIDISPSTVGFCKSLNLSCELVNNTSDFLVRKAETYDFITLLDVLEHVPKQETIPLLKSLFGSLKMGGKLVIQTPNLQSPDGQLHRCNDFTHEFGYIEHSLFQVLFAAGFKAIEFKGLEEFVYTGWKYKTAKILRFFYWKFVRFTRKITGNLNPEILNPVFFAVATKTK